MKRSRARYRITYSLTKGQATTDKLTRDQTVSFCHTLTHLGVEHTIELVQPQAATQADEPKMDED